MFGHLVSATEETRADILGDLFQGSITYGERGQFMTPESICEMMAAMSLPQEQTDLDARRTVNDPCCGSGRMLLASAKIQPNWHFVGQDVDLRCTRMTAINLADCERQGYRPDSTVSASEMPAGRPYPFMCLQNAINLQVETVAACVKVDDTLPGIEEGLNAGMWTIGLAISGNEVGLNLSDWEALPKAEKERMRERAYGRMLGSGAHYVVDEIADLMPCIEAIQGRIRTGERP